MSTADHPGPSFVDLGDALEDLERHLGRAADLAITLSGFRPGRGEGDPGEEGMPSMIRLHNCLTASRLLFRDLVEAEVRAMIAFDRGQQVRFRQPPPA